MNKMKWAGTLSDLDMFNELDPEELKRLVPSLASNDDAVAE